MFPYIYNESNNIHILDLVQSAALLKRASQYLNSAAADGKTFLFIGTKSQAANIIKDSALKCTSYYVNYRWLGGMLTNWRTLKNRVNKLKKLEQQEESKIFDTLTKKELSLRYKEMQKLRNYLQGIKNMKNLPDIVIIIDPKREITAIRECKKLNIPIVSILDSNCDPDLVDIPIPGNDDAVKSIKLILNTLTDSILRGQEAYKKKSSKFK